MAFKMKGSPAKRGIIEGTAKHSALKLGLVKTIVKKLGKYFGKKSKPPKIKTPEKNPQHELLFEKFKENIKNPVKK